MTTILCRYLRYIMLKYCIKFSSCPANLTFWIYAVHTFPMPFSIFSFPILIPIPLSSVLAYTEYWFNASVDCIALCGPTANMNSVLPCHSEQRRIDSQNVKSSRATISLLGSSNVPFMFFGSVHRLSVCLSYTFIFGCICEISLNGIGIRTTLVLTRNRFPRRRGLLIQGCLQGYASKCKFCFYNGKPTPASH